MLILLGQFHLHLHMSTRAGTDKGYEMSIHRYLIKLSTAQMLKLFLITTSKMHNEKGVLSIYHQPQLK